MQDGQRSGCCGTCRLSSDCDGSCGMSGAAGWLSSAEVLLANSPTPVRSHRGGLQLPRAGRALSGTVQSPSADGGLGAQRDFENGGSFNKQ
ncbi:hypothetical protein NDU88_000764 [Pleurodeles waltl]|uniref:Uncharacterized protein n=1 Tax=Pleurodeles waltl TaxID=8319 RepID=A0AAV7L7V1_PLEWA|nr:hypothetical protein NDU88_000764 [Pleurodeles waltl]